MVQVELRGVWKYYGKLAALRGVNLRARDSELLVILGPSGAGKTTLLKVVAGLLRPERGSVLFDGEDVTNLDPFSRHVGFVFQKPALFPHLKVWQNIAFPLEARGWRWPEIVRRVNELIDLLRLRGLEERYPNQLSGGQQQRVAIARALASEPRVLLLDEPFSNLDPNLREELRSELKEIQRASGTTTIFVTHDQLEAFQIADRVAVLLEGTVVQMGRPEEVYFSPKSPEVARFLGLNVIRYDGRVLAVWPEHLELVGEGEGDLRGTVISSGFQKNAYVVLIRTDSGVLKAVSDRPIPPGTAVGLRLRKRVVF